MIRLATKEDGKQIDKIRSQIRDYHINGVNKKIFKSYGKQDKKYTLNCIESGDYDFLVYEEDDKILGYVLVRKVIKEGNSYSYGRKYLNVDDFGVDEKYRNRGIGKQLFEEVKTYAKNNDFNDIKLDVWNFNKSALNFYENLGFEIERMYLDFDIKNENF